MTSMHSDAARRLGDADTIVGRVLEIAGARWLALDAMLRLSAVEWSDDVASACVECAAAPRLLLNPAFVEAHCDTPRKLAFLVLHELSHVSLGHTGLHARITAAQNVAFDAVINASLLQGLVQQRDVAGWEALVVSCYAAGRAPEFILRPPPGWPDESDWEASRGLPGALRRIHQRLYERRPYPYDLSGPANVPRDSRRWHSVTYGEILLALEEAGFAPGVTGDEPEDGGLLGRLLGAHGTTETERAATTGGRDALAAEALAEALAKLPRDKAVARGDGGDPFTLRLDGRREDRLVVALRALLRRALVAGDGERRREAQPVPTWAADPTRDRRARVRRHAARLLGAPAPLLFRGESTSIRSRADGAAAVYLDVSGSMGDWAERLHAALVPLRRMLAPRLFAFSTIVDELSRADFVRGRLRTTGGTDVTPVLRHLTAEARAGRLKRALLLTDGLVGAPDAKTLRAFLASGATLHVGLTANGTLAPQPWTASVTKMPN